MSFITEGKNSHSMENSVKKNPKVKACEKAIIPYGHSTSAMY